jgi:dipeptidyl aminopeptidase/acylaminoacyl peptidase
MLRRAITLVALTAVAPLALTAQVAQARRPLRVDDLYRLRDVRDPQRSPDGQWVAYTVSSADSARDKNDSDVWMTSWDGTRTVRLTSTSDGESTPRWSPDGRYLAFLSSRQNAGGGQVWLLDRQGGEAVKLTSAKGGVSEYAWSPDSKRLVLLIGDPDPAEGDSAKTKTAQPIVIDRYAFKRDIDGYLSSRHDHLYLFDVATKTLDTLTRGAFDDATPAWSPDGRMIAFASKRDTGDVDRHDNRDIYVIEARAGATARRLTTFPGTDDGPPAWSPDGSWIAYLRGGDPKYEAYTLLRLAIVPAGGGASRTLAETLDRPVAQPRWSADGRSIVVLVADDRKRYLARVPVDGGAIERIADGTRVINAMSGGSDGAFAVLAATPTTYPEVFALEGNALRQLSHQNDSLFAQLQLGTTEGVEFRSKDGTEVHGVLVKPAGAAAGTKLPLLLRIHGGPSSQDQYEFNFERELFAANGYAVLAVNYRGSNGRGEKYGTAIFADWGNKEVQDLLAGIDHVVATGVADPDRLGIGGWSYGGILTDYTIASTNRFKAAISGAGSAMQLAMYGADQYITQYETELGPPWKNQDLWLKVSYPFFHADRIRTPTLFLVGEKDFNVPAIGSEQMYQALRSLGVPTQLVIYPGQFHGITTPSYKADRLQRYLAWYDRYLKPMPKAAF